MQTQLSCPRCGQPMTARRCPACGFSNQSLQAPIDIFQSSNVKYWVAGIAAYVLVCTAVLTYVGRRMIRDLPFNYPRHQGPVARREELKGAGRIYLVQMGDHRDPYSLEDLAQWLRTKYALDVEVLPPTPIHPFAWNASRGQYVVQSLYAQLKWDHPDLASDPDAYLIGFTDGDIYTTAAPWSSTYSQRDWRRAAVISSEGLQDTGFQLDLAGHKRTDTTKVAVEHFHARLRRILLKNVAALYWHLQFNRDPTSLLNYETNPNVPAEDIYESDLHPGRTEAGLKLDAPCVLFEYSVNSGMRPRPGPPIGECSQSCEPDEDTSIETFSLDLRLGLLVDKRTDFFLPDSIPITFQRATRDGWKGLAPFGISGSDSYDQYLSSADNITIQMVDDDGMGRALVRSPRELSNLNLVKYVDTTEPGLYEMRWHATPYEHYDARRFDGSVLSFLPCLNPHTWCYLTDYHDFQGHELRFVRGERRRLERLISPNQNWVQVDYDPAGRIGQVSDSQGRAVQYDYDGANRLSSVRYPSGEVCLYAYDDRQHLVTFSASPDGKTPPRVLMQNEYANGLLIRQTFADGTVSSYTYTTGDANQIKGAVVRSVDGRVFVLKVSLTLSTVRER
jgi:YD repeat-containing protein